jgi:glycine cleavage system H protein
VKTAADIYSPIEGSVHEVNEKLVRTPKLINSHSESQGWYVKLKVNKDKIKNETAELMSADAYNKFTQDLKK